VHGSGPAGGPSAHDDDAPLHLCGPRSGRGTGFRRRPALDVRQNLPTRRLDFIGQPLLTGCSARSQPGTSHADGSRLTRGHSVAAALARTWLRMKSLCASTLTPSTSSSCLRIILSVVACAVLRHVKAQRPRTPRSGWLRRAARCTHRHVDAAQNLERLDSHPLLVDCLRRCRLSQGVPLKKARVDAALLLEEGVRLAHHLLCRCVCSLCTGTGSPWLHVPREQACLHAERQPAGVAAAASPMHRSTVR